MFENTKQFTDYDFPSAVADLIDNSLFSKAKNIEILCEWNDGDPIVRVIDDGAGMDKNELIKAMEWASTGFNEERDSSDHGRFGLGLKIASMSQCDHMIVASIKNKKINVMGWNFEKIKETQKWSMEIYNTDEIKKLKIGIKKDGTEVIWRNCSGLTDDFSLNQSEFNSLISDNLKYHLERTFHRYLDKKNIDGSPNSDLVKITLNKNTLNPISPFFKHSSSKVQKSDVVNINNCKIQAFTLPSWRDLSSSDLKKVEGKEGTIENQGFYLYRQKRLIIPATWFNMRQKRVMTDLLRIKIDIGNDQDKIWKISGNKKSAEMPQEIKSAINKFIETQSNNSKKGHRKKGKPIKINKNYNLWKIRDSKEGWTLQIDKNSQIIKNFIKKLKQQKFSDISEFRSLLTILQDAVPVAQLTSNGLQEYIAHPEQNRKEYKKMIKLVAEYQIKSGVKKIEVINDLKLYQEFANMPELIKEVVEETYIELNMKKNNV